MNTDHLVTVTEQEINGELQPAVDARELHGFLDVRRDFTTWIKSRIEQYEFVEGTDFLCSPILGSKERGGHNRKEYALTLDMAKELAMVERTEKGRLVRRYFIECERRFREMSAAANLPAATKPEFEDVAEFFDPSPLGLSAYRAKLETVNQAFRLRGQPAALQVWQQMGLPSLGDSPLAVAAQMIRDEDRHINQFGTEALTEDLGNRVPTADMYLAYKEWCADENIAPVSHIRFGRVMRKLGFDVVKSNTIYYLNVRILASYRYVERLEA